MFYAWALAIWILSANIYAVVEEHNTNYTARHTKCVKD